MKYVIVDFAFPIVFSEAHAHNDFKNDMGEITSAGYCKLRAFGDGIECYGRSSSLGLHPDLDNDERILNKLMGFK